MQKAQASTVVVILQRAVPVMLAIAVVTFALFGLQGAAVAAESGSIGSGATILTGKVVTTVTRAAPVPFHAVVDEVLVKPGQPVDKGTPLMRYHLQEEAERVLQREVTTGAGTEDLKGQVLDLERRLAETAAQRNKARQLAASGLGSAQASSRLEDDVHSLQRRIDLLRVTIQKSEKNFSTRLEELSGYFGKPIREGESLPKELTLTAPIDGYVLSLDATLYAGALLGAGSSPIRVGKLDPVLIQVPVYEAEISGIKAGDSVEVEIPSLNGKKFAGTVNEISWVSTDMSVSNPSYYSVEITVPNPNLELKPGFKAVVRFKGSR
ncbi:HlyD family secretion protein [Desulfovibrio sp.]|uniref:HlyD family secretion protein n=1 Tax=Desulfovibrio sp. TaxID=885 RepID=UPI0035B13F54